MKQLNLLQIYCIFHPVYEGSKLKEGDIIIKPIGRTTPIKIDGITYDCIREGFIFAKLVDDGK